MKDVTARSLADRRVISHFALVLVNRTQVTGRRQDSCVYPASGRLARSSLRRVTWP